MRSGGLRSSRKKWALLYEEAVSETDERRRLNLIALARGAIFQRKRELVQSGVGHFEEQAALEDASYVLRALRRAAEFNRKR